MPGRPDSLDREARDLLTSAGQDLETAEVLSNDEGRPPRHACMMAHLAAEKALKAALVARGIDYPFTHDLDQLREELPESDQARISTEDLGSLAGWSIKGRYGALANEPTRDVAQDAVRAAKTVLGSAATIVTGGAV